MSYQVMQVDLSNAFGDVYLVPPGTRVSTLLVTYFPAGTAMKVALGDNAYFRIPSVMAIELGTGTNDEHTRARGVRLTNPVAQAGVVVEIVIVMDAGARFN